MLLNLTTAVDAVVRTTPVRDMVPPDLRQRLDTVLAAAWTMLRPAVAGTGAEGAASAAEAAEYIPEAAAELPAGLFAAALAGAATMDTYAHSAYGRTLVAHAVGGLVRDGWVGNWSGGVPLTGLGPDNDLVRACTVAAESAARAAASVVGAWAQATASLADAYAAAASELTPPNLGTPLGGPGQLSFDLREPTQILPTITGRMGRGLNGAMTDLTGAVAEAVNRRAG